MLLHALNAATKVSELGFSIFSPTAPSGRLGGPDLQVSLAWDGSLPGDATRSLQRWPRPPDLHQQRARRALRLKSLPKPSWVDLVARVDAQAHSCWGEAQSSSFPSAACSRPHDIRNLCEEGQLDRALDALSRMDQQGNVPTVEMYRALLSACTRKKALYRAKRVQANLEKHGLVSTRFLGESVVKTLVKCGGLKDALELFQRLPRRTVVSWTAVISGYTDTGQGQEALRTYQLMQENGVKPNAYTFVSLLKACSSLGNLEDGQHIHAEAVKHNWESDLFVRTCLVDMYGKCGSIGDAQCIFDECSVRDVVSWNALLSAYAQQGQSEKVLELYGQMKEERISPDDRTFVNVLQVCGMLAEKEEGVGVDGQVTKPKSLGRGVALHADTRRKGYDSNRFVGNTLVSMYGKCGSIKDAQNVFDGLLQRDVVSWTSMLVVYAQQDQAEKALRLYEQMYDEGVSPDARTFVSALQVCCSLAENEVADWQSIKAETLGKGKAMHGEIQRKGYCSDVFVGSALVSMYGKCGSIVDAKNVFDALSQRDAVAWSVMLAVYVRQNQADKALQLYEEMWEQDVTRDAGNFISALQVCGMVAEKDEDVLVDGHVTRPKSLVRGKILHAHLWSKDYNISDVILGSTLLSMYGKCGSILDAQNTFDGLTWRDVAAWSALLSAYCQQNQADKVLQLYEQMCDEGMSPDNRTFVSVLQACGMLAKDEEDTIVDRWSIKQNLLAKGKTVHALVWRKGYDSDVFVGSSLISVYGKCGSIIDAQNVFQGLPQQNVVSWTAMLTAYVEEGAAEKALELYSKMQHQGLSPNEVTVVCMLQACSQAGSLAILKQTHDAFVSGGNDLTLSVANTLVHAYGRCASMVDAQAVFDALPHPGVVTWNALIAGYAREGDCAAALQCYEKMLQVGVTPTGVTFLSLISACSHAGRVEKGVGYFESMSRDYAVTPGIEHYASMIDLLGRAGCFDMIEDMLSNMPMKPSLEMWLCLLGACQKHGKVTLGEQAFHCAVLLNPKHSSPYVLMSNIYASVGLSSHVNQMRIKGGALKEPGRTWIEHEQELHTFVVGDNHSKFDELVLEIIGQLNQGLLEAARCSSRLLTTW